MIFAAFESEHPFTENLHVFLVFIYYFLMFFFAGTAAN